MKDKDLDRLLDDYVDDVENFLTATDEARALSERDHDYVNHRQWTAEEAEVLERRGQQPVVINRIKRKVNILCGIQKQTRTDPKALPRTPKHEDDADTCTAALRYVADNVDFDQTSSEAFYDEVVWGYGGAIVEVEDGDEPEISVKRIEPDRFYFDPYSRKKDFSDAGYMGVMVWMDTEEAKQKFPDHADEIEGLFSDASADYDGDTFRDRPEWVDRKRGRVRIAQHYCIHKGVWHVSYFTDRLFLIEPMPSPYLDEKGRPDCPIEMQSAYVNIDNERYGEVRGDVWIQDEINHRRSKLLLSISTRQTLGELGAVDDVNEMKRQMARADGHVTINPEMRFEILPNDAANQTQFALYQESKAEIDQIGLAGSVGDLNETTLSGAAIERLQQGGMSELTGLYDGHKAWERRVYRQIWNRVRQLWDGPKWVRVTDNEDSMKWVGLNQPVTAGEKLRQMAEEGDQRAVAMLQQMLQAQDPRLNQVVEVANPIAEMDVDIIVAESPDYHTTQQQQFESLAQLAGQGVSDQMFAALLELSPMPNKDRVKEILGLQPPTPEQIAQQQQEQAQATAMAVRSMIADLMKKEADAEKTMAEAEETRAKTAKTMSETLLVEEEIDQKQVETVQLASAPAENVNVSV